MLLTFLGSVSLPRDERGERDPEAPILLYNCIWVMHLGSALVVLLNQHFPHALGIGKYTLNTCMTLFNVAVIIVICMEFFAQEGEDGVEVKDNPASWLDAETESAKKEVAEGEAAEGEGATGEAASDGDTKPVYDAAMLRGWFAIEVLMFMAILVSNMVFVLARSCSRIRILGTRTTAVVHAGTDMIEEQ